jgi:hypothetical protein
MDRKFLAFGSVATRGCNIFSLTIDHGSLLTTYRPSYVSHNMLLMLSSLMFHHNITQFPITDIIETGRHIVG